MSTLKPRPILTRDEAKAANVSMFIDFDGNGYNIGDRVELHPGCDLWMRGARFGTVVGASLTPNDRVHVRMDHPRVKNLVRGPEDRFRLVR